MFSGSPPDSALVGRQDELDLVVELLTPRPGAVVLAGEAGVGKTRLSVEVLRKVADSGTEVLRTIATSSSASIPLGPLAPLVDVQGDNRHELFVGTVKAFGERGRAGPILVVVDDAHLLDPLSAAVIQAVVIEGTCSVLATIRSGEPAPDPITALWKDGLATRIEIQGLSRAESSILAESLLQGTVDAASQMALWKTSQGNPLYLRESIFGSLESGALTLTDGVWRLEGDPRTSGRLREVVASTIDALDPDVREAMELLSVADPIGLAFLVEASGSAPVESLERRGLIAVERDRRRAVARPAHPLFAEAVRARMQVTRGRAVRERLAELVIATGARRRNDPLDVAVWQLDAGVRPDVDTLRRGAHRAESVFDVDLTGRLRQAAYDSSGDVRDGFRLGEAIAALGRFEEAEPFFADLMTRTDDPDLLRAVVCARAYNLGNRLGRESDAHDVLDRGIEAAQGRGREWLLGYKALIHEFGGRPDSRARVLEPLLVDAQDNLLRFGGLTQARCLVLVGRLDDAIRSAGSSEAAYARVPGNQPVESQRFARVMALAEKGELADAAIIAGEGREAMLALGSEEGQATFLLTLARIEIARGRVDTAAGMFLECVAVNRAIVDPPAVWWALAGFALSLAFAGRADDAAAALAEMDLVSIGSIRLFEPDLLMRARAWTAVAAGEVSRGRDLLAEAAAFAASSSQHVAEATLLHDIARLGDPAKVTPRLAELAKFVDSGLVAARAAHVAALCQRDGAGLLAVSERFAVMEAWLLGAEAGFDAARAFQEGGSARRAASAAAVGARLLSMCEGASTPGSRWASAAEALTAREQEIAGLARRGLTSKQIGDRLFLSPRTVDNHLAQAFTKLGISKRSDLAGVLADPDLE